MAPISYSLILASASPRRRELLEAAGWQVDVRPAHIEETPHAGESPELYVLRMAREKSGAVAKTVPAGAIVLGADTDVVLDGEILGKPHDHAHAREILRKLAGRGHEVFTGVSLRSGVREVSHIDRTRVWLAPLSEAEIADYVASGEADDKAGGYALQGRAARFIPRIEGSCSNVIGLPLATVWELWKKLAVPDPPR